MDYLKASKADVAWLKRNGSKAGERVQSATFNLAMHIEEHSDWTFISELDKVAVACSGIRSEAWRTYVAKVFDGLRYDTDKSQWLRVSKKKKVTINHDVLAVNFWDYTKEAVQEIDLDKIASMTPDQVYQAYLAKCKKQLQRALEGGSYKGDVVAAKERLATV